MSLALGDSGFQFVILISRVRHDPYFQWMSMGEQRSITHWSCVLSSPYRNSDRPSKPQCPHHEPRTNKNAQYPYATPQNLRIHGMYDPHAC